MKLRLGEKSFVTKKHDYNRSHNIQQHRKLLRPKHKNQHLATNLVPNFFTNLTCNCGKRIKDRSLLLQNNKICKMIKCLRNCRK